MELQQIAENPHNYDAWFDYIRLLQNEKIDREEMEDAFERAIANVPPEPEKRFENLPSHLISWCFGKT